jgi:hypothetical protein
MKIFSKNLNLNKILILTIKKLYIGAKLIYFEIVLIFAKKPDHAVKKNTY